MINDVSREWQSIHPSRVARAMLPRRFNNYLVDVTTVDVTAATYRSEASNETGGAARKAVSRKVQENKSKVDGVFNSDVELTFK